MANQISIKNSRKNFRVALTDLSGELLGDKVCSVLSCLHALTGTDFTYPFFRRTKFQTFKRMLEKQSTKYIVSLKTENVDIAAVIDFILHTVYNRPKKEKTPGDTRFEMLAGNKNKSKKYLSTKVSSPDTRSLEMKIKRANFISHMMCNCLESDYVPLDPLKYGWKMDGEKFVPIWFEGSSLPSDEEYDRHLAEVSIEISNCGDEDSDDDDDDEEEEEEDTLFPPSEDDWSENDE